MRKNKNETKEIGSLKGNKRVVVKRGRER